MRQGLFFPSAANNKKSALSKRTDMIKIGICFDLKTDYPAHSAAAVADLDDIDTIVDIKNVLLRIFPECSVQLVGNYLDLCKEIERCKSDNIELWDFVFNLSEGGISKSRNRESFVPCILEMHNIPFTFSDPQTSAVCMDKSLAKIIVQAKAGVLCPKTFSSGSGDIVFPVIAKPNCEGSSMGVSAKSVLCSATKLEQFLLETSTCATDWLIESFLDGRECTVSVLNGNVMGGLWITCTNGSQVFGMEEKSKCLVKLERMDSETSCAEFEVARRAYEALGCRDLARIDIRHDSHGVPHFIECNPLPGLKRDYSDACEIATAQGISYEKLIEMIVMSCLDRYKLFFPV